MNVVETTLLENIGNPASLFVFPTNVAVSGWADRLLRLSERSTIAMDKFIAWDTFKQNSICSKVKNKKSVAAVLRKMFTAALIRENAELCAGGKAPVFTSLIRTEWAQQADSFSGWLAEIIPQLGAWFTQISGLPIAGINEMSAAQSAQFSGDDRDLFALALHYSHFLDQHDLFEPAWETPPFGNTGKECFIFFPESLSDFAEYKQLLESGDNVHIISANADAAQEQGFNVFYYSNSRSEITEAALYIRALHDRQNVPWDCISVSIPDDELYGPYLLREFSNRNIPCIRQTGKTLSSYPAGQLFAALAACASSDFSFTSLKELLLNRRLPWKEPDTIDALIEFGINNNCISSWTEDGVAADVWEDAFTHPLGGISAPVRRLFTDLKHRIHAICHAASFTEIRKHYFIFRERFFNMDQCLDETDIILSRCISELMYLVDIEQSYPAVHVPNPYSFFCAYLNEVNYLAQQSEAGVSILPYRTAAPAPFDCHIILGASQSSLSAIFSPLAFLPQYRREELNIADNDASLAFIRLHWYNSRLPAAFFCSEQNFTGYAIPHSALGAPLKAQQRYGGDDSFKASFAPDLYREESNFYASLYWPSMDNQSEIHSAARNVIHEKQRRGFINWRGRNSISNGAHIDNRVLAETIRAQLCRNRDHQDKFSVSSSSLAPYFQCPLLWIFSRVLNLENIEIDTGLMASTITGEVFHAILNLFLDELKQTGEVIAAPQYSGPEHKAIPVLSRAYSALLAQKTNIVFNTFPCLPGSDYQKMSMLSARLLRAEQSLFVTRLENLLAEFTSMFSGYRVIASEEQYTSAKDNYFLNGRIDCILEDTRGASQLAIIDFKTKYTLKLSDYIGKEGLTDFQLPMYIRLAEEAYKREVHTALFFSIIDTQPLILFGDIHGKKDCISRGTDTYNDIMNQFDRKTEQFAAEISNGAFSFLPSAADNCGNCDYNKVCRTLYKVHTGKNNGN